MLIDVAKTWRKITSCPPEPGERILICSGSLVVEGMMNVCGQIMTKRNYAPFSKVFPHRLPNGWTHLPPAPGCVDPPPPNAVEQAIDILLRDPNYDVAPIVRCCHCDRGKVKDGYVACELYGKRRLDFYCADGRYID